MRRIPAIVLLLVAFSLSLISPLLLAGQPKELPACCRRDGKHHCAKQMSHPSAEGVQIAATSVCPLFPSGKAAPASVPTGSAPLVAAGPISVSMVAGAPYVRPETRQLEAGARPSTQRGPPSLVF